jgi:hypothetical protein
MSEVSVFNMLLESNQIGECMNMCSTLNYTDIVRLLKESFSETITERTENKNKNVRIRLLCNWCTQDQVRDQWNKMSKGNYTWNNLVLVQENSEYDYTVVINSTHVDHDKSKSILIQMEPMLNTNPEWIKNRSTYKYVLDYTNTFNNHEWHIPKTYTELMSEQQPPKQNNTIVSIVENNYSEIGSIKKIDLVQYIITKDLKLDVYGYDYNFGPYYKGEVKENDNVYSDYKYAIVTENVFMKNYHTCRLIDAILSECLVFYKGDYTLREVLPVGSFIELSLNEECDCKRIKYAIETNEYEKRLPLIRQAKNIILNHTQFFPRLEKLLV